MPRKENEAIPESNGTIPQQEEFGSDQPTLADVYRMMEELFDKSDSKIDKACRRDESDTSAFSKPRAGRSAATSCHGGRRASRREDSRAHGRRHYSRSSDA